MAQFGMATIETVEGDRVLITRDERFPYQDVVFRKNGTAVCRGRTFMLPDEVELEDFDMCIDLTYRHTNRGWLLAKTRRW